MERMVRGINVKQFQLKKVIEKKINTIFQRQQNNAEDTVQRTEINEVKCQRRANYGKELPEVGRQGLSNTADEKVLERRKSTEVRYRCRRQLRKVGDVSIPRNSSQKLSIIFIL